jgi:hypothetical protein
MGYALGTLRSLIVTEILLDGDYDSLTRSEKELFSIRGELGLVPIILALSQDAEVEVPLARWTDFLLRVVASWKETDFPIYRSHRAQRECIQICALLKIEMPQEVNVAIARLTADCLFEMLDENDTRTPSEGKIARIALGMRLDDDPLEDAFYAWWEGKEDDSYPCEPADLMAMLDACYEGVKRPVTGMLLESISTYTRQHFLHVPYGSDEVLSKRVAFLRSFYERTNGSIEKSFPLAMLDDLAENGNVHGIRAMCALLEIEPPKEQLLVAEVQRIVKIGSLRRAFLHLKEHYDKESIVAKTLLQVIVLGARNQQDAWLQRQLEELL